MCAQLSTVCEDGRFKQLVCRYSAYARFHGPSDSAGHIFGETLALEKAKASKRCSAQMFLQSGCSRFSSREGSHINFFQTCCCSFPWLYIFRRKLSIRYMQHACSLPNYKEKMCLIFLNLEFIVQECGLCHHFLCESPVRTDVTSTFANTEVVADQVCTVLIIYFAFLLPRVHGHTVVNRVYFHAYSRFA